MGDPENDRGTMRPSWKERSPLIPIEEYTMWSRDDGLPFDPWLRVHARLDATTLRPEPRSMRITGSVGDDGRLQEGA